MITVKKLSPRRASIRAPEWLAPLLVQAIPGATPAGAGMHLVPARACVLEQLDQLVLMASPVDQAHPDLDRALRLARRHEQLGLALPSPLTPGLAPPSIPALPRAPGLAPAPSRGEFTLQELVGIQQYLDGVRAIGARLANLDLDRILVEIQEHQELAWRRFDAKRGSTSATTPA